MMAAMVQMAGSLNLTAIAEIIETEAAAGRCRRWAVTTGRAIISASPSRQSLLCRPADQHPFQQTQATGTFAPQKDTTEQALPRWAR